ncbi:hypothetical protein K440DRAFT_658353 [Wilcoxina mikolae CBS 423.85]|nr:hypothetical protein K440DRAFT_658353 [Wilcoxina mikolae CBS 423.85]
MDDSTATTNHVTVLLTARRYTVEDLVTMRYALRHICCPLGRFGPEAWNQGIIRVLPITQKVNIHAATQRIHCETQVLSFRLNAYCRVGSLKKTPSNAFASVWIPNTRGGVVGDFRSDVSLSVKTRISPVIDAKSARRSQTIMPNPRLHNQTATVFAAEYCLMNPVMVFPRYLSVSPNGSSFSHYMASMTLGIPATDAPQRPAMGLNCSGGYTNQVETHQFDPNNWVQQANRNAFEVFRDDSRRPSPETKMYITSAGKHEDAVTYTSQGKVDQLRTITKGHEGHIGTARLPPPSMLGSNKEHQLAFIEIMKKRKPFEKAAVLKQNALLATVSVTLKEGKHS